MATPPPPIAAAVPTPTPINAGATATFIAPTPVILVDSELLIAPNVLPDVANAPVEANLPVPCIATVRATGMQSAVTGLDAPSQAIAAHILAI